MTGEAHIHVRVENLIYQQSGCLLWNNLITVGIRPINSLHGATVLGEAWASSFHY